MIWETTHLEYESTLFSQKLLMRIFEMYFGLGVTIVTNVKDKKETKAFLTHLGFPFKKVETNEVRVKEKVTRDRKPKVKAE
jgi:hypothetical protein